MSLRSQAFGGIIWTFGEMFGGQLINFFVNILLARLLVPEDYGLLGMIFIFITLSNTLMDSGVAASIMREQDPKEEDFSTLFVSNVFFSVVLYTGLFFTAPLIADFYDNEIISNIIRVYGLTIIIQAFVQVQSVYLIKKLNFKKQTLMKLPSIIISSIIAIIMAYKGYGVWSLVFMYLLQNFFWALFHWVFGDWNPKISFKKNIFKRHFSYGYRMTLVELMNNVTANIYQIVIGKFYNPAWVGYYTQSHMLSQVPVSNIYGAAIKVLFPTFAKIQDNREALIKNFYRCQELLMLIVFPILVFLAFNAEEILVLLFSEKWIEATIYLQILSVAGILNVMSNWNLAILKIISHSNRILQTETVLKLISFFLIGFSILMKDMMYLLISIPFFGIINYVVYTYILTNLLNEKISKGLFMVFKVLAMTLLPVVVIYLLEPFLSINNVLFFLSVKAIMYFSILGLLIFIFKKSIVEFLLISIKSI